MVTTTDPVCGKQFESSQAVAETEHDLQTYFFCSEACRATFETHPEQFSANPSPPACANCGGSISQDDWFVPTVASRWLLDNLKTPEREPG